MTLEELIAKLDKEVVTIRGHPNWSNWTSEERLKHIYHMQDLEHELATLELAKEILDKHSTD